MTPSRRPAAARDAVGGAGERGEFGLRGGVALRAAPGGGSQRGASTERSGPVDALHSLLAVRRIRLRS
ncbi:hypothetical protein PV341_20290 [Streptomyces sp. PA03-1a]|nr:hypothetical protein [Streptomyces sp. PA03-1a]MDX2813914.1 hypothetical protein [Streptomyces sp. PA03-5A]